MCIRDRCMTNPKTLVQFYVGSRDRISRTVEAISDRLEDLHIDHRVGYCQITLTANGSIILINVPVQGDIIFDDAFDTRNVTMLFTPVGWTKHQAPSTENPLADIPDDIRRVYSKDFANSIIDGNFKEDVHE